MAAGRSYADEKIEVDPSSPGSVLTGDLWKPQGYDTEAASTDAAQKTRAWRTWLCARGPNRTILDIEETDTRQLEKCPIGYPRLGAFLSSEPNFSVYRGFGYLHARVLLGLQDQIAELERELDQVDSFDGENGQSCLLRSRARDERTARGDDEARPRPQILDDIRRKLVQYDEVLFKARELASFQKPSNRDYRSVRTWFANRKPLIEIEEAFIKHKEDVITLHTGREWCGFDGFVESLLLKIDCKLVRWMFLTPELRAKTRDPCVNYYKRGRVDVLVGLIITGIIFVLLVLPVVAMYRLTTLGASSNPTFSAIGVLVVFTLLFSAAMSLLTKARRHELFAASAAYCAVLVVFISNVGNAKPLGLDS